MYQGNPNIKDNEFGIVYFQLLYRQTEGVSIVTGTAQAEIVKDENGNDKAVNKELCINVRNMCWKICRLAEICYFKDKEKFDFFNYNLVDTDYHTRKTFGIINMSIIK